MRGLHQCAQECRAILFLYIAASIFVDITSRPQVMIYVTSTATVFTIIEVTVTTTDIAVTDVALSVSAVTHVHSRFVTYRCSRARRSRASRRFTSVCPASWRNWIASSSGAPSSPDRCCACWTDGPHLRNHRHRSQVSAGSRGLRVLDRRTVGTFPTLARWNPKIDFSPVS